MNKLKYLPAQEQVNYWDAIEYLYQNWGVFPSSVPAGGPSPEISQCYWKSHRFILTTKGEVVFGDCIVPGINKQEFEEYCKILNTVTV